MKNMNYKLMNLKTADLESPSHSARRSEGAGGALR
jgi:hypothetical protein